MKIPSIKKCEECPYGGDEIRFRRSRLAFNEALKFESCSCEKVGGKHSVFGWCNDSFAKERDEIENEIPFLNVGKFGEESVPAQGKNRKRAARRYKNYVKKKRRMDIALLPGYHPFRGYVRVSRTPDGKWETVGNHVEFPRSHGWKRYLKKQASRAVRRTPLEDVPQKSSCKRLYELDYALY